MAPRPESLRGPIKVRLIQELALQARTQRDLADEIGVTQQAVADFARRNSWVIADARAHIEDEFRGLWISAKVNRLAELEDDVERINDLMDEAPSDVVPRLMLSKHRALRNAAEELGQLTRKYDVGVKVEYSIEGVDMDQLR